MIRTRRSSDTRGDAGTTTGHATRLPGTQSVQYYSWHGNGLAAVAGGQPVTPSCYAE